MPEQPNEVETDAPSEPTGSGGRQPRDTQDPGRRQQDRTLWFGLGCSVWWAGPWPSRRS